MPRKAATKKSAPAKKPSRRQEVMDVYPPADSILVDQDVALWFQSQGPRYRSKISSVLRAYMNEREKAPKRAPPKRKKSATSKR